MMLEDLSISGAMRFSHHWDMAESQAIDPEQLKNDLEMPGRSQSALARFMGLNSAAIVNRICKGERKITDKEADQIRSYLLATDRGHPNTQHPDLPEADPLEDYVAIEVLPTHAGLGGGGTGDADRRTTLVSRALVDSLGVSPNDLLVIDCEGDSMIPIFMDGDRVIVNRRKTSLAQPGIFALWDGDGYVLKNVERDRQAGTLRVFSENPKYTARTFSEDDESLIIVGRPAWFARRV
jgi:phage repressor protein C with HTH and peptisase S24 domain